MTQAPLSKEKEKIAGMFDSIAPHYDFLNHFLSFNIDRRWRRALVRSIYASGSNDVLDLACGTGDVSRAMSKIGVSVTGMDISDKMLEIARSKTVKGQNITYIKASAENIPFPNDRFEAVTVSFGVRNFDHRQKCLEEIYRVLWPGGTVAILEFTIPTNRLWKAIYTFYFTKFLPAIGSAVSHQQFAYTYLPKSTLEFPQREDFCEELCKAGFKDVSYRPLTGGVACIYIGIK